MEASGKWREDMLKWRGRKWAGPDAHWCGDWDDLPVDAFTPEYETCTCQKTWVGRICNWFYMLWWNSRMPQAPSC